MMVACDECGTELSAPRSRYGRPPGDSKRIGHPNGDLTFFTRVKGVTSDSRKWTPEQKAAVRVDSAEIRTNNIVCQDCWQTLGKDKR